MRILLALMLAAVPGAFAQTPQPTDVFEKAPPETDQALRARVAKFFQAHVDGKFRQAEQVIHEDSRDEFYNAEKTRLISYEISSIKYSEKFTKAEVITIVELNWATARTGRIRVKPPMKTTWKLDKGEWWWYVQPRKDWETPFGVMKPGADPVNNATSAPPKYKVPDVRDVLDQVKVDKVELRLKSDAKSEDSTQITNNMPGDLTLSLVPYTIDGLTVSLDKEVLHAGESAKLTFKYSPPDASLKTTKLVYVKASPIAQTFTFTLTFAVPPEFEKYMPKKPVQK